MPAKIRLARHGRKRRPFYHIVIADSRAPRDGKYIERIGSYNPNTNPATIDLDFEKALQWLQNGAQPTDTARAILSYEGVMMKKHLLEGVKKGAFDEAAAEAKYEAWKSEKDAKIAAKKDGLSKSAADEAQKRLDAEAKISADRAEALAKKAAEAEAAAKAEEAGEEGAEEAANEEADNTEA
ncbi:MAG: 30S ribosomal protein S16 [Marinifilaceae bacterium]